MNTQYEWLLNGPAWVQYRTRLDLLGQTADELDVLEARRALLADQSVRSLMADVDNWPGDVLKRHNDAKHQLHKLNFLLDLGINQHDEGMKDVVEKIMHNQSPEGPFQVVGNIPTHFGGTGQDALQWMLCDAPLVSEALIRLGFGDDLRVVRSISTLSALVRENGWPCAETISLGTKFKGPGEGMIPAHMPTC